jgi:Mg2+-importing ATPase
LPAIASSCAPATSFPPTAASSPPSDLLSFWLLYAVLGTSVAVFQTAWFVESMATQVLVIFVFRTVRSPLVDRPSRALAVTSIAVVAGVVCLPSVGWTAVFGFVPLPPLVLATVSVVTLAYLVAAEAGKHWFHRLHPELPEPYRRGDASPVPRT